MALMAKIQDTHEEYVDIVEEQRRKQQQQQQIGPNWAQIKTKPTEPNQFNPKFIQ